jgi:signal transduction histidine kinase
LPSAVHEINNPLDALLNLLYVVESDDGLSERSRENLRMAQAEVRRISDIAHTAMKQFHGPEAATESDVGELLASVLKLHAAKLKNAGISVVKRNRYRAKFLVYPALMRQVFNNLLLNAIDAMPNGGRLHMHVAFAHEWLGWKRTGLRVTIADNGSGIARSVLHRVREPFFTTKGAAGNGMGLAVVQEIISQHFGILKIRSCAIPGRSGTVMAMFIPSSISRRRVEYSGSDAA